MNPIARPLMELGLILPVTLILMGCGDHAGVDTAGVPTTDGPATDASGGAGPGGEPASSASEEISESLAVFQKRILPIFQSDKPSSCSDCHLSGVNLKSYIRPTQSETFAALVNAKLINIDVPEDSKLLSFIRRAPESSGPVSQAIRSEELEAFQQWITACINDPQLVDQIAESGPIGPQTPLEVIRHARTDRVLTSFTDNVWTEVGRCAACHSPDRNQKQVEEHGEQVSWIQLKDPRATMQYMLENELINTDVPEKSLLLMKPTNQIEHGGGVKMEIGDRTWQQFRRFIDDYSATVRGTYTDADQLPVPSKEVSVVSEIWLKIEGVPEKYDGMLLQADLFQWTGDQWSDERIATSDRAVFGKGRLWQHSLSLTAPRGSARATEQQAEQTLPSGRYQIRISVDQSGRLKKDDRSSLTAKDAVGVVEVESSWAPGYGRMTVVQYPEQEVQ